MMNWLVNKPVFYFTSFITKEVLYISNMKNLLTVLILFTSHMGFCQTDSLVTARTGGDVRPIEWVVIVDGYIIYDTAISNSFLQKFADKIVRRKAYSVARGYKKFGIVSKDGLLYCFLKSGSDIDFAQMGITDRIKSK